ncbi:MAG: MFS transporter, partial [Chloroflexota bacterium]|nr:MFS transporter [Chloroflexota bacterium]
MSKSQDRLEARAGIDETPGGEPAEAPIGPLTPLRRSGFRNLWTAELMSQTAQNAIWFAALVATERETRSSALVSVSVVAATLPFALLGVLAGILVDRWDRKSVLIWSNVVRTLLAVGYLAYGWSVSVIFVMNFMINVVAQFYAPAMLAIVPELVPKRLLTSAVGLFNVAFNSSQVLGIVILGPLLVRLFGP